MLGMYRYIYQYKENGSMPPFFKVIDQLVTPNPQDDFAIVMDQRLPHENPWDLNCHI